MECLVSILIPAFNAENWIADTICSALAQTWPHKELIVVDDGSTDRTLAIAQSFAGDTVTVVQQESRGASAARNCAFAMSRGDYIQWLDADDLLVPNKIASQMEVALGGSRRILLSGPWGGFMYRPSRAVFESSGLWFDLAPLEWLLRKWEGNFHMQTATWLVSRLLTEEAGPWDERLSMDDDGEYFSRVVRASEQIRFVPEARVLYRITSSTRLSYVGRDRRKMESQLLSMKLQIGYLRQIADGERMRSACLNYLRTWLPIFHPERPDIVAEVQSIARSLGGALPTPRMSWKYAWIERLFGARAGKQAQLIYNRWKSSVFRRWDRILHSFESFRRPTPFGL